MKFIVQEDFDKKTPSYLLIPDPKKPEKRSWVRSMGEATVFNSRDEIQALAIHYIKIIPAPQRATVFK